MYVCMYVCMHVCISEYLLHIFVLYIEIKVTLKLHASLCLSLNLSIHTWKRASTTVEQRSLKSFYSPGLHRRLFSTHWNYIANRNFHHQKSCFSHQPESWGSQVPRVPRPAFLFHFFGQVQQQQVLRWTFLWTRAASERSSSTPTPKTNMLS